MTMKGPGLQVGVDRASGLLKINFNSAKGESRAKMIYVHILELLEYIMF